MSQPSETDGISELPDDIVISIFNHLPAWDAFRASLATHRWADIPRHMPRLDFDMVSMFQTGVQVVNNLFSNTNEPRLALMAQYADKFVPRVNHLLHFHSAVQIQHFTVTFTFDEKHTRDLEEWVIFALGKGVKHLTLNLQCDIIPHHDHETLYQSSLLSPKLFSQCESLISLSIYLCRLESGRGFHFPNLGSLKLSTILIDRRILEAILSSCLNLETLTLEPVEIKHVRIPRSLNRLKYLLFSTFREVRLFQVCATNIECFHHTCYPERVTFSGTSRLTNVSFSAYTTKSLVYIYGQLANVMPELESLSMKLDLSEIPPPPKEITTFSKLKYLHFALKAFRCFDAIRITNFLKACPLLEMFLLEVCTMYRKENIIRRLPLDYGVHDHLKEVRIVGFTSGRLHVEIASYILQYCVALERMVFEPVKRIHNMPLEFTPFNWDESERDYLRLKLNNHPRISLMHMM